MAGRVPAGLWWAPIWIAVGALLPERARVAVGQVAGVAVAGVERLGGLVQVAVAGLPADWPLVGPVASVGPVWVGWPVAVLLLVVVASLVGRRGWLG